MPFAHSICALAALWLPLIPTPVELRNIFCLSALLTMLSLAPIHGLEPRPPHSECVILPLDEMGKLAGLDGVEPPARWASTNRSTDELQSDETCGAEDALAPTTSPALFVKSFSLLSIRHANGCGGRDRTCDHPVNSRLHYLCATPHCYHLHSRRN